MKGQGIADFLAIASLRRDGIVPERDVVFVAEPGEETFTPEVGIGWVLEHRPDLLEGVTDVFNEGGVNEVSGDRIARFGIEVLQKATVVATAVAEREEDLKAFTDLLDGKMRAEPYRVLDEVQDFLAFVAPSRSDLWGHQLSDARAAVARRPPRRGDPGGLPRPDARHVLLDGAEAPSEGEGLHDGRRGDAPPRAARCGAAGPRCRRGPPGTGVRLRLRFLTPDSVPRPGRGGPGRRSTPSSRLDPVEDADVGPYVLTGSYTNLSYLRLRGIRALRRLALRGEHHGRRHDPQQEREDLPPRVRRRRRRGRPGSSASTPSRPDGEEKGGRNGHRRLLLPAPRVNELRTHP